MFLYLTADVIGSPTGGGTVTANEMLALKALGPVQAITCDPGLDPFAQDRQILERVGKLSGGYFWKPPKLAHCYAGCLSETVKWLKRQGVKVSYTAAAHDVQASRREHEKLGVPFDYRHLTDPALWSDYVAGYLAADLVVCPSLHSRSVMESFDCKRIEVVPHGVDLPGDIRHLPGRFTCGYLGAYGPDKGVRYLLDAWKRLAWTDAILILAGRDSTSPWVRSLVERFGGGSIRLMGWVPDVADFYGALSVYCQPSVTEGFGIEVLESMAHGRPVLCSNGAGAVDIVPPAFRFDPGDVDGLVSKLTGVREGPVEGPEAWKVRAQEFTWDKVRRRYVDAWKNLLTEEGK